MKALPMFDNLMLWIARGYTAAMLILFVMPLFMLALNLLLELPIYLMAPHTQAQPFFVPAIIIHQMSERPHSLITLASVFLCFAAVRMLWSIPARICLGLTSGFLLLGCLMMANGLAKHGFHPAASGFLLFFLLFGLIGTVGFASMLWVSIRPPKDSRRSSSDFGAPPVPNPLNHINPI